MMLICESLFCVSRLVVAFKAADSPMVKMRKVEKKKTKQYKVDCTPQMLWKVLFLWKKMHFVS
jgi:hypothetical protein